MSADHDPLCVHSLPVVSPMDFHLENPCDCDLIARVRADERQRARQRVEALASMYHPHDEPPMVYAHDAAAAAGGDA